MPVVLMILDGWGISEQTDGNAIAKSNTKNIIAVRMKISAIK